MKIWFVYFVCFFCFEGKLSDCYVEPDKWAMAEIEKGNTGITQICVMQISLHKSLIVFHSCFLTKK